jgi:hypothetical protein
MLTGAGGGVGPRYIPGLSWRRRRPRRLAAGDRPRQRPTRQHWRALRPSLSWPAPGRRDRARTGGPDRPPGSLRHATARSPVRPTFGRSGPGPGHAASRAVRRGVGGHEASIPPDQGRGPFTRALRLPVDTLLGRYMVAKLPRVQGRIWRSGIALLTDAATRQALGRRRMYDSSISIIGPGGPEDPTTGGGPATLNSLNSHLLRGPRSEQESYT